MPADCASAVLRLQPRSDRERRVRATKPYSAADAGGHEEALRHQNHSRGGQRNGRRPHGAEEALQGARHQALAVPHGEKMTPVAPADTRFCMSRNADAPREQLSSVEKLIDQVRNLGENGELTPAERKQQLVRRRRQAKSCAHNRASTAREIDPLA